MKVTLGKFLIAVSLFILCFGILHNWLPVKSETSRILLSTNSSNTGNKSNFDFQKSSEQFIDSFTNHISSMFGQERILSSALLHQTQYFGEYKIDTSENVINQCKNREVRTFDLTKSDLDADQKKLDDLFIKGREEFKDFMKHEEWKPFVSKNVDTYVASFLALVFSSCLLLLYILKIILWLLNICCCDRNIEAKQRKKMMEDHQKKLKILEQKEGKMSKEQKALKNMGILKDNDGGIESITQDEIEELGLFKSKKCKKIAMGSIFFVPLCIFVMMVLWVIKHSMIIAYTDRVACSISIIASDILNGLNYKSEKHTLQFAGILGYDYQIAQVMQDFKFYYEADVQTIIDKKFYNYSSMLNSSIPDYISDFKNISIQSPNNKYAKIQPDSIKAQNDTKIINEAIDLEYTQLKNYTDRINEGFSFIYDLRSGSAWTEYILSLQDAQLSFQQQKTTIQSIEEQILGVNVSKIKYNLFCIMVCVWCVVWFIIIWFWIGWYKGFKSGDTKSKWYRVAEPAYFFQLGNSVCISIIGLVMIILASVVVNICHYQYIMYNNKFMITEFKPKDEGLIRFTQACLYDDSPGLIFGFLIGNASVAFMNIDQVYSAFNSYNEFNTAYTDIEEPVKMAEYIEDLRKRGNYTLDDWTQTEPSSDKDFTEALKNVNLLSSCYSASYNDVKDIFVFKEEDCVAQSITSIWKHTENGSQDFLGARCCMVISTMDPEKTNPTVEFSLKARYLGSCLYPESTSEDDAESYKDFYGYVKALIDFYAQRIQLYEDIIGDETLSAYQITTGLNDYRYNSEPGANALARLVIRDIKETTVNKDNLLAFWTPTYSFIKAFHDQNGSFAGCAIFRQGMEIFSHNVCHKFAFEYSRSSIYFSLLGPLMCFLTLAFGGVLRCRIKKSEKVDHRANLNNMIEQFRDVRLDDSALDNLNKKTANAELIRLQNNGLKNKRPDDAKMVDIDPQRIKEYAEQKGISETEAYKQLTLAANLAVIKKNVDGQKADAETKTRGKQANAADQKYKALLIKDHDFLKREDEDRVNYKGKHQDKGDRINLRLEGAIAYKPKEDPNQAHIDLEDKFFNDDVKTVSGQGFDQSIEKTQIKESEQANKKRRNPKNRFNLKNSIDLEAQSEEEEQPRKKSKRSNRDKTDRDLEEYQSYNQYNNENQNYGSESYENSNVGNQSYDNSNIGNQSDNRKYRSKSKKSKKHKKSKAGDDSSMDSYNYDDGGEKKKKKKSKKSKKSKKEE